MSTNLTSLTKDTHLIEDCLEYCKKKKLLSEKQVCLKCRFQCDLVSEPENTDQYIWKCPICHAHISVRNGSIFERSKLELSTILRFIYLWAYDMASYENIRRECNISSPYVIAEWTASIRTLCNEYFFRNPCQIGGSEHTVEIDESLYTRRQNNADGSAEEPFWVFGGYDPAEKDGFLIALPDQESHTLMLMIKKYILPGTTILLNSQDAFDRLGEEEYEYLTVEHFIKFVDPDSKPNINQRPGQRIWKEAKSRNKNECGLKNSFVDTYLTEFMWRQKFRDDTFDALINQIACIYNFEQLVPSDSTVFVKQEPQKTEEPYNLVSS